MLRMVALTSLALVASLVLVACGQESTSALPATDAARGPHGSRIFSKAAQLQPGSRASLLHTPAANVAVTCKRHGRALVRVEGVGPTSFAVVSSPGDDAIQPKLDPGETVGVPVRPPATQTWTISPFAEAGGRPAVITVSVSDAESPKQIYRCAVLAMAVVGDRSGTVTR